MIVIVDSDGFIGTLIPQDQHFKISQQILSKLLKKDAKLIYPATVIAETATLLQGRLNQPELAEQILQRIIDNQLTLEPIDSEIIQTAAAFMDFKRSKHHTLFDAIVAAVAQKYHADAIFSFDHFYKSKGFKIASDLYSLAEHPA